MGVDDLVQRETGADIDGHRATGDGSEELGRIGPEHRDIGIVRKTEGRVMNRQPFLLRSSGAMAGAGPEAAP